MPSPSKRFNPDLFSLKYFERLLSGVEIELPDQNDLDSLMDSRHRARLFLGHYSSDDIMNRLDHYGVLPKLRRKGFTDVRVTMDLDDLDRQMVRLFDRETAPQNLIAEIIVHPGDFITDYRRAGVLRNRRFQMLYIQWLCLQNPRMSFTPQRPALPGQHFPGLKVGREVMRMLAALAEKFHMAGIINVPEFPHAAVLYSTRFRFLNPTSEGILRAFQRDMADRTVAEASWGIVTGCVKDIATNEPTRWFQEEQVLPLSKEWIVHFEDERYKKRVKEALNTHRFVFDQDRWDSLQPINPDGSPKQHIDSPQAPDFDV